MVYYLTQGGRMNYLRYCVIVSFVSILLFSIFAYAEENGDLINKFSTVAEDWIKDLNSQYQQRKEKAHANLRESLNSSAEGIDNGMVRQRFLLKEESKLPQEYQRLDSIYDQKLKGRISEAVSGVEDALRKDYVEAKDKDKGKFLSIYESVLDKLVLDGYISADDASERKSKVFQDWPAARVAYGR